MTERIPNEYVYCASCGHPIPVIDLMYERKNREEMIKECPEIILPIIICKNCHKPLEIII